MTHTITLAPNTASERVIDADRIITTDFAKTHTGLGDWRATVAGTDRTLKDYKFEEVWLEDGDGEFLFRGYVHLADLQRSPGTAETELGGRGIGYDLTNGDATVTYTNEFGYDAVEDYITNETGFDATVTTPTPDVLVDDRQIQEASTTAEFNGIQSGFASDVPVEISSGGVRVLQTGFFAEAEGGSVSAPGWTDIFLGDIQDEVSGDDAITAGSNEGDVEFDFTIGYDIPNANIDVRIRTQNKDSNQPAYSVLLDGTVLESRTRNIEAANETEPDWNNYDTGNYSGDLTAGSHTLTFQPDENIGDSDDNIYIDCMAVVDSRFNQSFPETTNANGALAGPELYPDSVTVTFDQAGQTNPYNVQSATATGTFNDTSNSQSIGVSFDGGSTWTDASNSASVTGGNTGAGATPTTGAKGRVTLSRFASDTTTTPSQGDTGQVLSDWELTIDGDDTAVFENLTVEGDDMDNLTTLTERSKMRFVVLHRKNSKEIHAFKVGDEERALPDVTVRGESELSNVMDYGNHVTVRGAKSGGSRITQTLESTSDIATYDKQHIDVGPLPDLESQNAVDSVCRSTLADALREIEDTAELEVVALSIDPGFSYTGIPIDGGSDTLTAPLEEIRYEVSAGELRGVLTFDQRALGLAEALASVKGGIRSIRLGI